MLSFSDLVNYLKGKKISEFPLHRKKIYGILDIIMVIKDIVL